VGGQPSAPVAPGYPHPAAGQLPANVAHPHSAAQPGSVGGGYAAQPYSAYGQHPHAQVPQHPAARGWPQQPQQPQPPQPPQPPPQPAYPYPFGYTPGARVNVTWSNGQRYPAAIAQVSGSQCLVVFPDGQQHWVDMQYLTPG
jgi:hypothetical protein